MKRWVWIEEHEVLALHGLLLAEHGGPIGVRDGSLLKSALARPKQHLSYGAPDAHELAAIHTTGIVRNHPFVDGNKRTGFLVGVLFLELNGYRFEATEESATRAMVALAAGEIDDATYAAFLRDNSSRTSNRSR